MCPPGPGTLLSQFNYSDSVPGAFVSSGQPLAFPAAPLNEAGKASNVAGTEFTLAPGTYLIQFEAAILPVSPPPAAIEVSIALAVVTPGPTYTTILDSLVGSLTPLLSSGIITLSSWSWMYGAHVLKTAVSTTLSVINTSPVTTVYALTREALPSHYTARLTFSKTA